MKNRIMKKLLSALLALAIVISSLPLTVIVVCAEEAVTELVEEKKTSPKRVVYDGTPESIEREMANRKAYTKKREGINASSEAAVYQDGTLVAQGKFREMWRKALSLAPQVKDKYTKEQIDKLSEVEFVLNKDIKFESTYLSADNFENGAMYVAHQKVTIDLNGHILRRTDNPDWIYADSVIWINDHSVVTIMDSNPTAVHKGKIKDHMWVPDSNGNVELKGGIIVGGAARSRGGGIFINKSSTVYMLGGTVAGNQATAGSGIFVGEKCTLDMSRGTSQVCYNSCHGSAQDGGAIYLSGSRPVLKGGYVHHNWSEDYGGGIMADDEHFTIDGTVVYANKAVEEGGGIYIGDEPKSSSLIANCRIIGNYSGERGGGVYLYSHEKQLVMTDCIVEFNCSKEHGGGICVGDYSGVDLTITGKMIVRKNYKSSEKNMANASDNSNLYLQGDEDLIVGNLSRGSEVWIRTGTSAKSHNGKNEPISEGKAYIDARYFYSDNTDYYVVFNEDPTHKNFHRFYLQKGTRPVYHELTGLTESEVETRETHEGYDATVNGETVRFPLYRGIFEYNLMSTSDFSSASPFYYSDGYFFEDPTKYNEHLATMSINMAVAAFGRGTSHVESNKYANHFANVKQLFSDIGCDDENFFANEDYQMKPTYYGDEGRLSTIGVAISQKEIKMRGLGQETYTLVPVAIRGGGYEVEWASNVTIGSEGEAKGFADAADQVTAHIRNYIEDYGLTEAVEEGKVKFWVVGYSRAGATANLTSKRLVDSFGENGNQVFGYTFEAPMGGLPLDKSEYNDVNVNGTYPTIHNTVNENDFVTLVAPGEMGFVRYGTDHLIGANHEAGEGITSSQYLERRDKMLKQLRAINPNYTLNDVWEVADVNIILGALHITDFIDKGEDSWDDPNWQCQDIYDFLRWFFFRVQMDGLNLPNGNETKYPSADKTYKAPSLELSRAYYSQRKLLGEIPSNNATSHLSYSDSKYNFGYSPMTVEEAVCGLMTLIQGLPADKTEQLMSVLVGNALGIKDDLLDFSVGDILGAVGKGVTAGFIVVKGMAFFPGLNYAVGVLTAIVGIVVSLFADVIKLYQDVINEWDARTDAQNAKTLNDLLQRILNGDATGVSVWDVLEGDEDRIVAEALPVILFFALNFASRDYNDNTGGEDDDGMWGIGTFINNMDFIVSSHYQEVSVAWVRSYDSFYDSELQPGRVDKDTARPAKGAFARETNTLSVVAEEGSSIFYSVDGGNSWKLYTKPVSFETAPEGIKVFSVSRGVKSAVDDVDMNPWSASIFGDGNIWFVIAGSMAIVVGVVAVAESKRKKKSA